MSSTKHKILAAALLALAFAALPASSQSESPRVLKPKETVLTEFAGTKTHLFLIPVTEGQFLRLKFTHVGSNVAVKISDSKGVAMYSSPVQPWIGDWFGTVLLKVDKTDTLQLEVKGIEVKAETARAIVDFAELRPFEEGDAKRLEAFSLFNSAMSKRSGPATALRSSQDLFAKAVDGFLAMDEFTMAGVSLVNLGWVLQALEDYENSIRFFNLATTIFSNIKDPLSESKAYAGVGHSENELGDYDAAVKALEKSLAVKSVFGIAYEDSTSLINIGLSQILQRDYAGALKSCERGIEVAGFAKSPDRQRRARSCAATAQMELGRYDHAIANLTEARNISVGIGDVRGEAESTLSLGIVHATRGDFVKALRLYEDSATMFRKAGVVELEAGILRSIASLYGALSNFGKAIEFLNRSLELSKGDAREEASTLQSLGLYTASLGRHAEAQALYARALELYEQLNDATGQMDVLASLGGLSSKQEKYDDAVKFYTQAISILPKVRDDKASVRILSGAASAFMGTNRKPLILKARQYFEAAAEIEEKSGKTTMLAMIYFGIGFSYLKTRDVESAKSAFETSALISRESGSELTQAWANGFLADASSALGRDEESILFGKKAINIFQKIRGDVREADASLIKGFLSDKIVIYKVLSDRLISIGRLAEAQTVLDLLKDEEYAGLTRAGEKAATVPYSLSEEKAVLAVDNLASLGRKRLELEKLQNTPEGLNAEQQKELDKVYDEIEKANEAFRGALAALKETQPGVKDKISEIEGQQNLTSALEDLQRETGEGAVAIYTVIGTDEGAGGGKSKFGWAVLVTPKESKAYPIDVEGIEDNVFKLREALSSPAYDPQPLAKKLYDRVFRYKAEGRKTTLEEDLKRLFEGDKSPTLMWSLDGVLRYVPTAALHDGERYLVERYRHVTFNRQSLTSIGRSDRRWSVLGLGVSEAKTAGGVSFTALPGAEKELKDLVRAAPEETGIIAGTRRLNAEFTKEEAIRLWQRGQYPVVHISSHFSFNPAKQEESFLLIGDGALYFNDIKNRQGLFNSVDLLALSACDTGMTANGKESESFAYLAQSLGAKTVLASLWKVSDAGTPELMTRFYKIRSQNPQTPKGEAFRQAQLSMLTEKGGAEGKADTRRSDELNLDGKASDLVPYDPTGKPRYAHPFYWSAFTLIGNWK